MHLLSRILPIVLLISGCSNNPIEVSDTKWNCEKHESSRKCHITFSLINTSDFVSEANVKIRAHRRKAIAEAVTNEVVGEASLSVRLSPNETKSINHELIVDRKLTQIVVSAWKK